ncbi:MAG: hypothetical protein A2189_08525, partial [Paenibacillus sp. RIFOXYA1_FULL_44_5]
SNSIFEGKLEDLAKITMGQSPKGEECNSSGQGLPLLNGPTEFGSTYPTPVQYTTDPKKRANKGDLLFCVRGSTVGRMNWADQEYAIGRGISSISPNDTENRYFVKSIIDVNLPYLLKIATGSTFPNITKDMLFQLPIMIPPKEEQSAISKIFESLDLKIQINNAINKNLEEMAQALFKRWFVDFEFPNENGEPYKSSGGEFEESEFGLIPKGWKVVGLGDLIEIIDNRGKTPPLVSEITSYPIIDVKALSGPSRVINFDNCLKFVDRDTYESWFRNGHPKPGDILLSTVGSLAEMKLFYGNTGCIAQNVVALRGKEVSHLYLYQYLKFIKNDLISYNIGSVQPSIKVTHIIKHKVLKPSPDLEKKFNSLINQQSTLIYNNFIQTTNLKKIRDTLLPKLMSGEIRVSMEREYAQATDLPMVAESNEQYNSIT